MLPPDEVAIDRVGAGILRSAGSALADIVCECAGISDSRSETVSLPPVSPRSFSESPGPWPGCMGARPCRSGSAKLLLPLPPYVVPSRENSAVFCERGRSCPSHHAHPLGGKLNGKIRISATKGSTTRLLGRAREDPEQRDDEVDTQVRLEVRVRLAATGRAHRLRAHVSLGNVLDVGLCALRVSEHLIRGIALAC